MTDPTSDTTAERPYLYFAAFFWRKDGESGYGWRGVTISNPVASMTDVEALINAINDVLGGGHTIVPLHFQLLNGPRTGTGTGTRGLGNEPCL